MVLDIHDIFGLKGVNFTVESPGFLAESQPVCVLGSHDGTNVSIFTLITNGFKTSERLLLITPWETYAIFKTKTKILMYRDAIKDINKVRRLDVSSGNPGLLSFVDIQDCADHITFGNERCFRVRINLEEAVKDVLEQI